MKLLNKIYDDLGIERAGEISVTFFLFANSVLFLNWVLGG